MARLAQPAILPLLVWHEQGEIDRIAAECDALTARVATLRPHSHARLALEVRLRLLRGQQLKLECELSRRQ